MRRRDSAWVWYGLAAAVLAALAIVQALGVLEGLGP